MYIYTYLWNKAEWARDTLEVIKPNKNKSVVQTSP